MKTKLHHALALGALLALAAAPSSAADHGSMDHEAMGHGTAPAAAAEPAPDSGAMRKTVVSGYTLTYTLLDMRKAMESGAMPMSHGAEKMKSHHLMVYALGPDGKPAASGQAGFLVVQPDKTEVKVMAMLMGNGFGADVDLAAKGDYAITAKIALGNVNLVDTFVHTVK